ncbi:MAG: major Facilitator Superfamily protein [Sphingomonas bacterium]|uniref:MFS transporter n=1 Tax=Sphingomonas bacterium TaxID=1895847 RepID=UPI002606D3AD|nr:MFS transporter [Sphingomonas bacterium]MDB5703692.1 major Facilitator Superfamily protein [Sphingomonas bacterium]
MAASRLKLAILLSYAIFAVLLNSVGTVILQSIEHFHVDKIAASTLEGFKDLPIAIASFLLASFLPRFGYRRGMMAGLSLVGAACLLMPVLDSFWMTRLLFLAVGIGFALTKIGVYSFVGLLTDTPRGHASLLNVIEGVFMLGVLSGYWLFSAFIDAANPASPAWLGIYWWLAGACAVAVLLLLCSPYDESAAREAEPRSTREDFTAMLALAARALTLVFVLSIFLYVLIEQGIGSWLPTFNRELLGLSAPMSVQAASIFAVGLAAGRLAAGAALRRIGWYPLLTGCLVAMAVLILVALPLAEARHGAPVTSWVHAPIAAFVFPLIGLCMAPIYPALNSAILSAMPRTAQSAMVGLIVVFSALGGTTGSFIVGRTFALTGGTWAFYLLLVPIGGVFLAMRALERLVWIEAGQRT